MRTHNEIDAHIEMLRIFWKLNPELRLGQLISNGANHIKEDVFCVEDKKLIDSIKDICAEKIGV